MQKIICIVGPTASGKTALGITLAKKFNGEVVSADSRMVYRGMEIGTAVPKGTLRPSFVKTSEGRQAQGILGRALVVEGVPHYLIGIVEPDHPFTVVDWREQAITVIDDILKRGKLPIVVGGTGLYFSVLLDNFEIPPGTADNEERAKLEKLWKTPSGKEQIVQTLLRLDPDANKVVDLKNSRRVIRAIEVCKASGKPFTQQLKKKAPLYEALEIGLTIQKEELEKRLEERTEQQFRDGLLEEVKLLKQQYGCNVPSMLGFVYKEVCQYLDGELSLEKTKEIITLQNRQYAKRQMTWFKRDKRIQWVDDPQEAMELVSGFLMQGVS